jgi:hypothetical protein
MSRKTMNWLEVRFSTASVPDIQLKEGQGIKFVNDGDEDALIRVYTDDRGAGAEPDPCGDRHPIVGTYAEAGGAAAYLVVDVQPPAKCTYDVLPVGEHRPKRDRRGGHTIVITSGN